MRRSRWDRKEEHECPKDQSRQWGAGHCAASGQQMDWTISDEPASHRGHHSAVSSPPHQAAPATPLPIDYRSESRRRNDNSQGTSGGDPHGPGAPREGPSHGPQPLMGPPSSHFSGSWHSRMPPPNVYGDSGRGHHGPPTCPPPRWAQAHPGYFQSSTGQYTFDMKWWAQQKQSMDAYLGGPSWRNDDKNNHPDPGVPPWSFGTRVLKNNRRHGSHRPGNRNHHSVGYNEQRQVSWYDFVDPHLRSSSAHHQGQKSRDSSRSSNRGHMVDGYGGPRQEAPYGAADPRRLPSSSYSFQKDRDNHDPKRRFIFDSRDSRDPRKTNPIFQMPTRDAWSISDDLRGRASGKGVNKKGKQKLQQNNKFDVPGSFKSLSLTNRSIRPCSTNPLLMNPRGSDWTVFRSKGKEKADKTKDDESATYAEAAKKKALAAAASKLRRTFLAAKKKRGNGECSAADEDDENDDSNTEMADENGAQDLTMPRRHPSCLEFDIDIRFSAKEWASVGRGQGGTSNILDIPQGPSGRKRRNSMQKSSGMSNDRVLGEEQEDSGTYSDTDIGRTEPQWSSPTSSDQLTTSSTFTRRRHLSESSGVIDLRKNPTGGCSTSRPGLPGRMRSCSMSLVEGASSNVDGGGSSGVGQGSRMKLHLMPKLRRLMLKQLLSMDKKSLQELVDDPRSRKAQFMVNHLMSEHRAALSQRLAQQRFKTPDALPDQELQLLNSLETSHLSSLPPEVVQQVREILALEQHGNGSAWEEVTLSINDLLSAADSDQECQVISPPPRNPTSTITIHDSDSEMEDLQESDSDRENEDLRREHSEENDIHDRESEGELHEAEEDKEEVEEDEEDEEEEETVEVQSHQQIPVTLANTETSDARDPLGEREAASPHETGKPAAAAPIPMLPQIQPLCVMETMAGGPSGTRDLASQVSDATMNLLTANQPPMSSQPPAADSLQVPGPSSLLLAPTRMKVKEERPSPISECGLCMHNPRTPHTSECVFPFGLAPASPVALISGPPHPLGTTPPQRPVPHLPPAAPQPPTVPITSSVGHRSIKQEKLDETYLKYEHVKRPSSEERPKNPAPPDALPLPLPQPAGQGGLHPSLHPRPLIFSPENDVPDPPRPPPPPPPQFSPRIKIERHTPVQFMCCCMRNECERSSTHSAEVRPPSLRNGMLTPQPHHSERRPTPQPPHTERRPTPHLYTKMEPPSPCASRARTPHQSLPHGHHFPHQHPPISPCLGGSLAETKVTVGVQTEKERPVQIFDSANNLNKRQYIPNLSLARSVTPIITIKVDQSTSTEDLVGASSDQQQQQQQQRGKSRSKGWWWHRTGRPRNHLGQLTAISNSLNDFNFSHDAGIALQQMMVFSEQETEFVRLLENIDQEIHELMRDKKRMTEELARLQQLRIGKLQQLVRQGGINGGASDGVEPPGLQRPCSNDLRTPRLCPQDSSSDGGDPMDTNNSTTAYNVDSISLRFGISKDDVCVQSTTDNASVVSSSQEKGPRMRSLSFSHTSSNDSSNESQSVRRQRCTSTCHSPGRSSKSKEMFQSAYLSPVNPSDEFYEQIKNIKLKVPQSVSNTDSETDNDAKMSQVPVESSNADAFYEEREVREATYRKRSNSLSSSAEGDTESEVPVDREEEEERISRSVLELPTDNGEAVVDSSEQLDDKVDNDSTQADSEDSTDKPQEGKTRSIRRIITSNRKIGAERDCDEERGIKKGEELEYSQMPGSSMASQEPVSTETFQEPQLARSSPEMKTTDLLIAHQAFSSAEVSTVNNCSQNSTVEKEDVNSEARPASTFSPANQEAEKVEQSETYQQNDFSQTCHEVEKEEDFASTERKTCSSTSSSPSSSPDSHKSRSSSGEHCYSLRSRGPPSRVRDEVPGSIGTSMEVGNEAQEENCARSAGKKNEKVRGEEEHADDEREMEEDEVFCTSHNQEGGDEDNDDKKRKRKRKTKRHRVNKRKKKKLPERGGKSSPISVTTKSKLPQTPATSGPSERCSSPVSAGNVTVESTLNEEEEAESSGDESVFVSPPPHGPAVLDIKVMGDYLLTASSNGTARCYNLASGSVMTSYLYHTDIVTCIGVIGKPNFASGSQDFKVVTGSADKTICIFDGKTGEVKQRREVGEGVRCLDISWGQLFLGTEGGCGARWNFKDKGVTEMVQFCGNSLTSLKAMTEGGRRVLLVAAKTTPLMIRDAMSGLFLRTLEHIQLTVYATVSHGGLLYTGGSNKAIVYYDFASGKSGGHISSEADVSCLTVHKGQLVATCYDGLVRIFSLVTGQLLHRIPVETTNKMFICSALYKNRLLVGNKKGEVVGCLLSPPPSSSPPASQ